MHGDVWGKTLSVINGEKRVHTILTGQQRHISKKESLWIKKGIKASEVTNEQTSKRASWWAVVSVNVKRNKRGRYIG